MLCSVTMLDSSSMHCRAGKNLGFCFFGGKVFRFLHFSVQRKTEYKIMTQEEHAIHHSPCHIVFTARCAIVQSAVLRLHIVCPSDPLSVTLVDQDHIGWKSWKLNDTDK